VDRAELAALVRSVGCRVTRRGGDGIPLEYDCPDPWAKVRMLDALAWWDARYDARVRRIALEIIGGMPDTSPALVARALHAAVLRRVRYVGEGIETFQPAADTWAMGLGDCDDSARLLVALARSVGLPARVLALANAEGVPVHATAKIGQRWAETSLPARFGEHPFRAFLRLRREGRPTYNYAPGDLGDVGAGNDAERAQARAALSAAWDQVSGAPEKTDAALQMVQSVALGPEGSDGGSCWSRCPGVCHNWAGLQLPGSPTTKDGSIPACPPGSAPCTDRLHDGSPYGVCFMTYPDQASGAVAYLQRLLITHETADVVGSGDADAMARQMYRTHYFGGVEGGDEDRIATYAGSIAAAAQRIATSLDEPVYVTRGGSHGSAATVAAVVAAGLLAAYGYRHGWHKDAARIAKRVKRRIFARS